MTRWAEDPTIEPPEGHRWMRPVPDECPACECHTARVCEAQLWAQASPPTYADGTAYLKPCPCRTAARRR